ncbi:hypothetical protein [Saccharococcus caldoxylosilyticus]|uniref:HTH-type transcriptional repressor KstR2 C-terminal domain-containing protein n=1 Tax=Saccharococcus caldoxylosilyticus TaxID=81408 RepID=A0A150LXK5_9BACL|nr:hypothetical protein [Parageobacillus caldoxylosilyticus]KYD16836.1 hypothetical protein B4119_0542 [Parageobacillus caldoxylosilyticus]
MKNRSKSPEEELRSILEGVIRFKWEDREMAVIIHQEMALQSPRLKKILQYTQPVWQRVREVLEDGKKQGKFHFHSLDHTLLVIMGAVLFAGANQNQNLLINTESINVDDIVSDTLNLIFDGLMN